MKKFTAAKNAGVIAFYEETEAERAQFARALAKELGLAFERDAEEAFLAALPADRGLMRQEIEKLALYAHDLGRKISVDDLDALLAGEAESALDAASLAAAQGRAAQAVEALARIDALSGVSALRALLRRHASVARRARADRWRHEPGRRGRQAAPAGVLEGARRGGRAGAAVDAPRSSTPRTTCCGRRSCAPRPPARRRS